jgi:ABC-2 type transport system permease protein
VNPYRAVAAARFRTLLQYRGAAVGGIFTQSFFALVRIMVLEAFYASGGARPPLSGPEVIGYIWLGQVTYAMFPWNTDAGVRQDVRTGNVAYELCRPLGLYGVWFSRAVALRTAPVLLRLVPMAILSMAVLPLVGLGEWRLHPPGGPAAAAAWLAAMAGGLAISCALTTLMTVSLLWTVSGEGVALLTGSVAYLLGGMVIPLPLYPDWAQPIVYALPFAGVMDLPARLYTGNLAPGAAAWVLAHQLAWTAALVAAGRWLLARATARLVVQGG